jgi:hypothetical protein
VHDAPEIVEVLDKPYPTLTRPLALVDGRAYAATWLYLRSTEPLRPPRPGQPVLSGRAAPVDLAAHGSSTAAGALAPAVHSLGRRPNSIPQPLIPNP